LGDAKVVEVHRDLYRLQPPNEVLGCRRVACQQAAWPVRRAFTLSIDPGGQAWIAMRSIIFMRLA
jgi:hypothetical protein